MWVSRRRVRNLVQRAVTAEGWAAWLEAARERELLAAAERIAELTGRSDEDPAGGAR